MASMAGGGGSHLEGASESVAPLGRQAGQKATATFRTSRQHRTSHPQIVEARLILAPDIHRPVFETGASKPCISNPAAYFFGADLPPLFDSHRSLMRLSASPDLQLRIHTRGNAFSLHPERDLEFVSLCYRSSKPPSQLGCDLRCGMLSSHAFQFRHFVG